MQTRELQTLWWDWLSTSERLLRSLHEQTAALTLRDIARVERIQPELDALLERVQTIDTQAAASAKKLAEDLGTEPSLRGLVGALEKAEAQQVQAIANRITAAARNLQEVFAKNRTLIESEMTYVNGTLTLIAKAAKDSEVVYTGRRGRPRSAAVLIDQAA